MNPLAQADAVISIRAPHVRGRQGAPVLHLDGEPAAWPEQAAHFLSKHVKWSSQRVAVLTGDEDNADEQAVLQVAHDHHAKSRIAQQTIEGRATEWGRNFLLTMRRNPPWATSLGEPFADRPAFIVAAGPSLDRNGHLLAEAQKRGPIVAVNTAVGACLHHGVLPDLVVCAEAKDVSNHLAPLRGTEVPVLLSSVASAENWIAADRAWGFVHHEPSLIPHALDIGTQPVNFGGSVACAATAIAMLFGAFPIVLIGQDLAYTDGHCYAEGTPFADLRAIVKDGVIHVHGASKHVHPMQVVWAEGWGPQALLQPTTHELSGFAAWFAKAAQKHLIVNTTEGGLHLAGMLDRKLESLLAVMRERPRLTLPEPSKADTAAVRVKLCAAAQAFMAAPSARVPHELSLLHLWAVPAILGLRDKPARVQEAAMREALVRGCGEILEVLG
jgi:hypothetical protein